MKQNVASQIIGAQMITASDGSAFTGSVTVYVTGDGGTQAIGSVGSGACTHEGNGFHTYVPAQAETNYGHIGFTFIGTGAVPVTIQVFTSFPQTGDSFARLGAPAGASVSADIATVDTVVDGIQTDLSNGTDGLGAIKADTAAILTDTGTTIPAQISGLNNLSTSDVQTSAAAALTAYDPPTKAELDSGLAALNDLDAAGVATAVWNAATATYGSAGSYGLLVETNIDSPISGATAPTAASVADAVWDEAIAGHLGAGSTGEALNAAGAAGDPWTTALPGAYGAGSAGYIVGTNLDAPVGTVDTVVDGIKAVTDNLPDSGALSSLSTAAALATVDGNVDSILTDTGTTIPAQISGLNNLSSAQVTAAVPTAIENADALLKRDWTSVTGEAARSALNALRLMRNKYTTSGTTLTVTKEDDSTTAWTSTLTKDAAAEPITGSDPS